MTTRLIEAAKAVSKEYTAYTKAAVELDIAISDAERQVENKKSELEQLRAENKKLRDAMQEFQILGRTRRQAFCEFNEVIGLKGGE